MTIILAGRLVLAALSITLGILAVFAWLNRHYHIRGGRWFVGLCISLAVYVGGFVVELGQSTGEGFFMAAQVQYLGLVFVPAFWICLVLAYTGRSRYLGPVTLASLFAWSVFILILVWTNNLHHLYYQSIIPLGPIGQARFVPGDLYPLASLAFYCAFCIGLLCLLGVKTKKTPYRQQVGIILVSTAIGLLGNLLYNLGLRPAGLDLSPFTLALAAVVFGFGLFRNRLFALIPIAREQVVESMTDAVVVLDQQLRILDFNPAARAMFPRLGENSLGRYCDDPEGPCPQLGRALKESEEVSGEFAIDGSATARWFQYHRSAIADSRGRQLGSTIVIADRTDYKNLLAQMTELATHDPLTGIFNRRRFAEVAEAEIRRSLRYGHHVALIMFDIDHFKHINDTWGHKVGDVVLKEIACRASGAIRTMDILARIGGEEFMVLLPDTDSEGAVQTAERIRQSLKAEALPIPGRTEVTVSASFGVSELSAKGQSDCWDEEPAITVILDQMMTQADDAMYQAKRAGRDQVMRHGLC